MDSPLFHFMQMLALFTSSCVKVAANVFCVFLISHFYMSNYWQGRRSVESLQLLKMLESLQCWCIHQIFKTVMKLYISSSYEICCLYIFKLWTDFIISFLSAVAALTPSFYSPPNPLSLFWGYTKISPASYFSRLTRIPEFGRHLSGSTPETESSATFMSPGCCYGTDTENWKT